MGQLSRAFALGGTLAGQALQDASTNAANWLSNTAAKCATVLGAQVTVQGPIPSGGMIVANHLGYLDIIALASALPCRFVAKSDVATWPVFGWFATRGGSLYVDRSNRAAVLQANRRIEKALSGPVPVVIFPEGTSSNGRAVLPFHSSLLESAVVSQCNVTPVGISYRLNGADPGQTMAYHSEMTLAPHLWNLLGHRELHIQLHFGAPEKLKDRKSAASQLHSQVTRLII